MRMLDIIPNRAIGRPGAATSEQEQHPGPDAPRMSGQWKRARSKVWNGVEITKGAVGPEARQGDSVSKGGGRRK